MGASDHQQMDMHEHEPAPAASSGLVVPGGTPPHPSTTTASCTITQGKALNATLSLCTRTTQHNHQLVKLTLTILFTIFTHIPQLSFVFTPSSSYT